MQFRAGDSLQAAAATGRRARSAHHASLQRATEGLEQAVSTVDQRTPVTGDEGLTQTSSNVGVPGVEPAHQPLPGPRSPAVREEEELGERLEHRGHEHRDLGGVGRIRQIVEERTDHVPAQVQRVLI